MKQITMLFSLSLLIISSAYASPKCSEDCVKKCVQYRTMCPDCKENPRPSDDHRTCTRPECEPMRCESTENDADKSPSRMCMNDNCPCADDCSCMMRNDMTCDDMPSRKCGCSGKKPHKSPEGEATENEDAE